jgi:hypothetical protein
MSKCAKSPFGAFFIRPKKDPGCPISRSFFARCGIPRLFAPDLFATTTFSAACLALVYVFFYLQKGRGLG